MQKKTELLSIVEKLQHTATVVGQDCLTKVPVSISINQLNAGAHSEFCVVGTV